MPGRSYSGPLRPLTDIDIESRESLKKHVSMLAERIGERNIKHYDALKASLEYIENELRAGGLQVAEQEYSVDGKPAKNIEAEIRGTGRPDQIVIVGAHYDSVSGSPGANDNASGVAALLELAGNFKTQGPERTLRFVAFVNEEPPYFQTEEMGSRVYARRSRERGEKIVAMISLETIGYYSNAKPVLSKRGELHWFRRQHFIQNAGPARNKNPSRVRDVSEPRRRRSWVVDWNWLV